MPDSKFHSQPNVMGGRHTVWLFTSESGRQWIDVTVAELPIEDVIRLFKMALENRGQDIDEPFHVQNLSLGGPLRLRRTQPKGLQLYFNDARKFHSDGRITL